MHNRYILPSFVERTSYGIKESNPYNKLFEDRIIFLGVQIDDASANDVMAQLLTLECTDPDRDIIMYINSPGGSFTAMTAIYDTMQYVRPDIQTVCLGQAASAAAVLLAAGTPGKRMALPNSRIIIHQPATEGGYGQGSDIEIQAREILRMRTQLEEMISRHSGQPIEKVRKDIDRDKIMTAEEAKEYGLVDTILRQPQEGPARGRSARLSQNRLGSGPAQVPVGGASRPRLTDTAVLGVGEPAATQVTSRLHRHVTRSAADGRHAA